MSKEDHSARGVEKPGSRSSSGRQRLSRIAGQIVMAPPRLRFLHAIRGKFGLLLFAIIALVLFAPYLAERQDRVGLVSLLGSAVILAGLHAARPGPGAIGVGILLVAADFFLGRQALGTDSRLLLMLESLLWLTTLLYVTAMILEAIFESSQVDANTLLAALCVYLLLGLIGTFLLSLMELVLPGSFLMADGVALSWADRSNVNSYMKMLSFSYATLSGVGTSKVIPATDFASNAASLGSMIGQIYLAVVIARLVGIESSAAMQRIKTLEKDAAS